MMTSPTSSADVASGGDAVLFVSFNQDFSSLSVGLNSGYSLHNLSSVEVLENIYDNEGETPDVCIVERLFSSSLVAIVSLKTPRKLKVCHFKKGTEICNYSYSNQILAVKLNRQRLVVLLEDSLYIHNIKDMKVLHTIRDTPPNPEGICALSPNNEVSYLAFPGNVLIGEVQIFDITNLKAVTSISAHNGPLATLAFNSNGNKLATASVKGTVIRVFSVPEAQPLFELRRGLKRCVQISCLAFSADSNFLCVSSNTETIHVFRLQESAEKDTAMAEDRGSWMGYLNKVVTASVSYLPTQVSSVLQQDRDFATAKLPVSGTRSICAIVMLQKSLCVVVAGYNGYIYVYSMDGKNGGICQLERQHCILNISQSKVDERPPFDSNAINSLAADDDGQTVSAEEHFQSRGDTLPHEESTTTPKVV